MSQKADDRTMDYAGTGDEGSVPSAWEEGGSPSVHSHISSKLKEIYAEVLSQPLPDKLLHLLSRLEGKAEESGDVR